MRYLNIKICKVFVIFSFLLFQANFAMGASAIDLYFQAQKSYYQLMPSAEKKKYRHHWMKTIKLFSKVVDLYPKSNEAYRAEFTTGKLFEGLNAVSKNSKDLDRAVHHYHKVLENYPSGNLSDDALFRLAEIYLKKRSLVSASETFKKIIDRFPEGDQANKARKKYKKIKIAENKIIADLPPVSQSKKTIQKILKQKAPIVIAKKEIQLNKGPSVLDDKNKKKFIVEFKRKIKEEKVRKRKVQIAKSFPIPAKTSTKSVKKFKEKIIEKAPSLKKTVKIKDGFGRGYLFAPKGRNSTHSPLVVVDAGHGGKDHGAKSASGLKEKEVNIKIAKHVKTILVNRYKYRVVMTRKDDTFIPLKDRSKISNQRNADLFVSIHANAAKRRSAHGIETYFLGKSHNKQALETASRENGELVKSVKDDQVQQILASLITTTKINDSSRLAGRVQENLYRSSKKANRRLKNLGVKEGPFYVLHGADMPSILVEVGFLTNRREAKMLSKPDYLYRLASSIAEGIHRYLQDKGPSI